MANIINRETFEKIRENCNQFGIERYLINSDGSINVDGSVNLSDCNLTELPLIFNKVDGFFVCSDNQLTTLKGSPKIVGKHYDASMNKLTSLEFSPIEINGNFRVNINQLTSLIGAPEKVSDTFSCDYNELTSLEGCPREIGALDCSDNKINTLKYFPDKLDLFLYDNNNLGEYFNIQMKTLSYDEFQIFMKYLKYYDCWNPDFNKETFDGFILDIKEGLK